MKMVIFSSHFIKIEAEVKVSGTPHVIKLWLGVQTGMLPVKYLHFNKASFYVSRISYINIYIKLR